MQIQPKIYEQYKASGAIRLQRITDKTFALVITQFDPISGDKLPDAIDQSNLDELQAQIAAQQAQLDGLNALVTDMQTLNDAAAAQVPANP